MVNDVVVVVVVVVVRSIITDIDGMWFSSPTILLYEWGPCIDPVSTDREWRYHLYTLVDITHGLNTEWKTETIVSRTRVRSTIGSTGYGVGHCAKRDDRESIYCSLSRTSPFADSYRYSIFATATTASTW